MEAEMTWTENRVEELKSLNAQGLSASQMGAELGVTRSCVMGKLSRLKIPMVTAIGPRAPNGAGRRQPSQVIRANRRPPHNATRLLAKANGHDPGFTEPPPVDLVIPEGQRKTLLELEPTSCRWPLGDPSHADFRFCGGDAVEGFPYCIGHCRIAYQPPKDRRIDRLARIAA